MTQVISSGRLALLRLIVKFPGVPQAKLLAIPGIGMADLDYLTNLDLVMQREPGRYRATHRGETVARRS